MNKTEMTAIAGIDDAITNPIFTNILRQVSDLKFAQLEILLQKAKQQRRDYPLDRFRTRESQKHPIDIMGFNPRARNILVTRDYLTLGHLKKLSRLDMCKWEKVGIKTIKHIESVLQEYGLELND